MPWLDLFLRRNPLFRKQKSSSAIVDYTIELVQKRVHEKGGKKYDDFLSRLFACQKGGMDNPSQLRVRWKISYPYDFDTEA